MPAATMLDSNHHTFLQAVMKRGPLSEKSAIAMYKSLVRSNGEGFGEFLLAINKELEFLQLELKKVMNQYDGKVFYGIINSLPSKEAKLGTHFSQAQILFFTAVMEAIVQDPNASGVISSTSAMNLKLEPQASEPQSQDAITQTGPVKMSMQAREEAMNLLATEQFLSRTEDGGVALGVKAFLELRSVFRNLEVPFCDICNEAAIKAHLCSTRDCPKRVHAYCITRGSSQSRNQRPKCSGCKTVWAPHLEARAPIEAQPLEEERVGTEYGTEEEEYVEPIATQEPVRMSRQTMISTSSRRKRSATVIEDEEGEHVEANGHNKSDEEHEVKPHRGTRSSRRR